MFPFCAVLAVFYVVHQIRYPRLFWRAMTLRGTSRKLEAVLVSAVVWLEVLSFGFVVWLVVSHWCGQ